MNADAGIPLYLFAKAPVPGQVKTRMQPQLTAVQSARLATQMLRQSVEKVCQFWRGKLILTVSPTSDYPLFQDLARNNNLDLEIQMAGDLGEKMLYVLRKGIAQFGSAVVMGSDVPHITDEILIEVHRLVTQKNNVIGPTRDGGFYLLGLNKMANAMFEGVDWGSERVMTRLCQNFQGLGIGLSLCSELRDIDNWDDLCWLGSQDSSYQEFVSGYAC